MNLALLAYLNGAHERLRAAFRASDELSNTTKGTVREFGLRTALEYCLPPIARLYSGDIIDAEGGQSGQLDFIVAHASAPALGSRDDEPRLVIAEGVLGVIELKSNLSKQWSQVETTWNALRPLRRNLPEAGFTLDARIFFGRRHAHPSEYAVPFYVIGERGWSDPRELAARAQGLRNSFGAEWAPAVVVAQLDPPGVGIAFPGDAGPHEPRVPESNISGPFFAPGMRGMVLANVWVPLSQRAQSFVFTPVDWHRYMGAERITAAEASRMPPFEAEFNPSSTSETPTPPTKNKTRAPKP